MLFFRMFLVPVALYIKVSSYGVSSAPPVILNEVVEYGMNVLPKTNIGDSSVKGLQHFFNNVYTVPDAVNKVAEDVKNEVSEEAEVVENEAKVVPHYVASISKTVGDEVSKVAEVVENEVKVVAHDVASKSKTVGDEVSKVAEVVENEVKVVAHDVANINLLAEGCHCQGYTCGCCAHLEEDEIHLNSTICVNVSYLPNDYGVSFVMTLNEYVLYNETISVRNPPPICIGMPFVKEFAELCARLYDIDAKPTKLHACVRVEARMKHVLIAKYELGCFDLGKSEENFLWDLENNFLPSVIQI